MKHSLFLFILYSPILKTFYGMPCLIVIRGTHSGKVGVTCDWSKYNAK